MYIFAFVCVVYVLPQRNAVKKKKKKKKAHSILERVWVSKGRTLLVSIPDSAGTLPVCGTELHVVTNSSVKCRH